LREGSPRARIRCVVWWTERFINTAGWLAGRDSLGGYLTKLTVDHREEGADPAPDANHDSWFQNDENLVFETNRFLAAHDAAAETSIRVQPTSD